MDYIIVIPQDTQMLFCRLLVEFAKLTIHYRARYSNSTVNLAPSRYVCKSRCAQTTGRIVRWVPFICCAPSFNKLHQYLIRLLEFSFDFCRCSYTIVRTLVPASKVYCSSFYGKVNNSDPKNFFKFAERLVFHISVPSHLHRWLTQLWG